MQPIATMQDPAPMLIRITDLSCEPVPPRVCTFEEAFPDDDDEAPRARAELQESGTTYVGGGAAPFYLLELIAAAS